MRFSDFTFLLSFLFIALLTLAVAEPVAAQVEVTHGPILGRPTTQSVGVWVRTSQPTEFSVRFGRNQEELSQRSPVARTTLNNDNTGWVELTGLQAGTRYFYQVSIGDKPAGEGGSFRTLKSAEQFHHPELNPEGLFNFQFEFACGNNQDPQHGNGPTMPTYTTMLREIRDKVDFAILNGDWLYEEHRQYEPAQWRSQVGIDSSAVPERVRLAPATVGVWENYKAYLARPKNLAEWHRHVPSFFTFDDHEIVNDVYGSGEVGRRDRRAVFRDVAIQAWYDYLGWSNPTATTQGIHFGTTTLQAGSDILTDEKADFTAIDLDQAATLHVHWGGTKAGVQERFFDGSSGNPNAGVYEIVRVIDRTKVQIRPAAPAGGPASYSIGRESYGKFRVSNCEFFLLDTRTNRQMHDVRAPDKKGVSMLGLRQRNWLMREMQDSNADFFFVVSSVNFMIPHIGGGGVRFDEANKDDAWTVFLDERETLIDFWDGLGKPVFVLTGDLHNSFAIKVTDRVWEFASGPHNSVNHRPSDEGDRPATGRYQFGPRPCEIRWSSFALPDIPRSDRLFPMYCVVQVNNVFNNPLSTGGERWVAFPQPQVIFRYHDGRTGDLRYAESISMTSASELKKKEWSKRQNSVETDK